MTPQLAERLTIHEQATAELPPASGRPLSPGGSVIALPARKLGFVSDRSVPSLLER